MAVTLIAIPLLVAIWLGVSISIGRRPSEKWTHRVVATSSVICFAIGLYGLNDVLAQSLTSQTALASTFLELFPRDTDTVRLIFLWDKLSATFVVSSALLIAIVGFFSGRYLHRDPGYHRFFLCYLTFSGALFTLLLAGNFETLVLGWEGVCLSTVLLIAFFQNRAQPAAHAFQVFTLFRVCDLGLLITSIWVFHLVGTTRFESLASSLGNYPEATLMGLLLLVTAMAKSAQFPFSFWLPLAMEGPTPSSAVFYGALSLQVGAFLMLRFSNLFQSNPILSATLSGVGFLSVLIGGWFGRVRTDAKTQLAYASVSQIGWVFAEIGLGFTRFAAFHLIAHSFFRTWQFLRAPALLQEMQSHRESGSVSWIVSRLESILPKSLRDWSYRVAFQEGRTQWFIERLCSPVLALSKRLERERS